MITIEVCVADVAGSILAARLGAHRLELNCGLSVGGLTPSIGLAEQVRYAVDMPIIAMLRPRPGDFIYSMSEIAVMERDVVALRKLDIDGFAFAVLNKSGEIDLPRCRALMALAPDAQWVFHRGFDDLPSLSEGLEQLIELGVCRVLTAGGADSAPAGLKSIAQLVGQAAGRIEILPGGGITPQNVEQLITRTACQQVHGTFSQLQEPSQTPCSHFAVARRITDETTLRDMMLICSRL
jgi:copper homeostasis protein